MSSSKPSVPPMPAPSPPGLPTPAPSQGSPAYTFLPGMVGSNQVQKLGLEKNFSRISAWEPRTLSSPTPQQAG